MGKIMLNGRQYGVGGITDASDIKYGSTDVESALNDLNTGLSNIGTLNVGTVESTSVANGSFVTLATVAIPADGIYLITGDIAFSTDTNGNRILILAESETSSNDVNNSVVAMGRATLSKTRIMSLSAGDTIYLRAYQNSGSAMTVTGRIRTVRIK